MSKSNRNIPTVNFHKYSFATIDTLYEWELHWTEGKYERIDIEFVSRAVAFMKFAIIHI